MKEEFKKRSIRLPNPKILQWL